MYFATIGEVCDDTTSHCAIENSQCEIADPQTGQRQCTCTSGRVETEHQGVKYCGTWTMSTVDPGGIFAFPEAKLSAHGCHSLF